jgi:hypothetical protein
MKKQEMIDKLVEQGHDAEELKDKKNAELKEMLKGDAAQDTSTDDQPNESSNEKPAGLADPVKTVAPKKAPQMMIPSTKKVMVVGKVYSNVSGAYIQPGKQCEIPENIHKELVESGRDKVLYSVK